VAGIRGTALSLLMPGMYVPAETTVHRLDPRAKLAMAFALMVLPFYAPSIGGGLLLAGFVIGVAVLARVPLLSLLRTIHTVFWIGFVMFFFYAFTTPGQPLVSVGSVSVTLSGLLAGGVLIYRLCLLVVISSLLTYTTSPSQLAHGLEVTLSPLARLGLPVSEMSMVLTIALRFVPTISDQIDRIMTAQRARGADPTGNPLERVQSWVPVFVPIFVLAFRRAEQLATAMEARGYRGGPRRTSLQQLHLGWHDAVAALITAGTALAVVGASYL
jgi:energy-coupling factor transport system permease protein